LGPRRPYKSLWEPDHDWKPDASLWSEVKQAFAEEDKNGREPRRRSSTVARHDYWASLAMEIWALGPASDRRVADQIEKKCRRIQSGVNKGPSASVIRGVIKHVSPNRTYLAPKAQTPDLCTRIRTLMTLYFEKMDPVPSGELDLPVIEVLLRLAVDVFHDEEKRHFLTEDKTKLWKRRDGKNGSGQRT
jgi:hypothetical protein